MDMLANLRSKVNQMASTLNMSNFANKDRLLGPEVKPDVMSRTVGLDNNGLVGFQRQIMKGYLSRLFDNILLGTCSFNLIAHLFLAEQDESLESLEQTVISTKHIALAVNEELDLHTRLIVCSLHVLILFFPVLYLLYSSLVPFNIDFFPQLSG